MIDLMFDNNYLSEIINCLSDILLFVDLMQLLYILWLIYVLKYCIIDKSSLS